MSAPERTSALVDGTAPRDAAERDLAALVAELRADPPPAPAALRARVRELARAPGGAGGRGVASWPRAPWPVGYAARRRLALAAPLLAALVGLAVFAGARALGPGGDAGAPELRAPAVSEGMPPAEAERDAGAAGAPESAAGGGATRAPLAPGTGADVSGLDPARPQDVRAETTVRVEDADALAEATAAAMREVRALGGYTASLEQRRGAGDAARARLEARVPVARVETALARFAALGTPLAQRAQIADLGARLDAGDRAARRLETRLDELRADLRRDPDSRVLLAELRRTRDELAALLDEQARTRSEARLATLALTLVTPRAEGAAPPGRFEDALRSGAGALGAALAGLLRVLVVTAPLWALGLAALAWRLRRRRADRRLLAA